MSNLSRYLFMAGALPFLVLGLAHALMTPLTPDHATGLAPRNPAFRTAMSHETFFLTNRTNIWRAWIGFNFSHSAGVFLIGAVALLIARSEASFASQSAVFVPLALIVSTVYIVLGIVYWFRTPVFVIGFAALCFLASWILMNAAE